MKRILFLCFSLLVGNLLSAQENNSNFATQTVDRKVESLLLIEQMSDVAYVDIVRLAGPAPAYQKKTGTAFKDSLLGNQLKFYSYVFIPRSAKQNKKYPLLVFPHEQEVSAAGLSPRRRTQQLYLRFGPYPAGAGCAGIHCHRTRLPRQHRLWPEFLRKHRLRRTRERRRDGGPRLYGGKL